MPQVRRGFVARCLDLDRSLEYLGPFVLRLVGFVKNLQRQCSRLTASVRLLLPIRSLWRRPFFSVIVLIAHCVHPAGGGRPSPSREMIAAFRFMNSAT